MQKQRVIKSKLEVYQSKVPIAYKLIVVCKVENEGDQQRGASVEKKYTQQHDNCSFPKTMGGIFWLTMETNERTREDGSKAEGRSRTTRGEGGKGHG